MTPPRDVPRPHHRRSHRPGRGPVRHRRHGRPRRRHDPRHALDRRGPAHLHPRPLRRPGRPGRDALGGGALLREAVAGWDHVHDHASDPLPCTPENLERLSSVPHWRIGPMGGLAGLDYAGARAACEGMGIDWAEALPGLRAMEAEALDAQPQRSPDP